MPLLEVRDLGVRYGSVAAVRGVSFTCDAGEIVTLVGPNGAGKTSILNAVAGALESARLTGDVRFDDVPILGDAPERIVHRGISLVPEGRRIFTTLTVGENLRLGATPHGGSAEDMVAVLERFPILAEFRRRPAGLLSGGQQQQLALARALLARPRVLLLDEPSLGLAPQVVGDLFRAIADLRDEGIGIVLVEQHARRAMKLASRCHVMGHGTFVQGLEGSDVAEVVGAYFGGDALP